jgi:cell volume regulation protein A
MLLGSLDSLEIFSEASLFVSAALVAAVLGRVVSERVAVPTAALLLLAAAAFSDVFPGVGGVVSFEDVQWIASAALVVILFDGGLHIGRAQFRRSAAEITALGVVGTFATAGLLAVAAHALLGFSWTTAGLLGAALAPTDPAVTFSVLGSKEVGGRSGTILEGESGFNDPVGIALMVGLVELATTDGGSFWLVVQEFAVEMSIGVAFGIGGGLALGRAVRHLALPQPLAPIWVLGIVGVICGLTGVLHGSGFIAVFIAGIMVGDLAAPAWDATEQFVRALANLAELAVFVALGLTVSLGSIVDGDLWWQGLALATLLAFVVRPLVVAPLLLPARLTWGERGFVVWSGLKGAVPILLASLAVVGGTDEHGEIYGIVFVVVLFSVVVQGTGLPVVASALRVPMNDARGPGGGRDDDDLPVVEP